LPTTPTTPVNTLTDKEALDQVQKTPLNIFWDYAETNSKLARDVILQMTPVLNPISLQRVVQALDCQ
jgi:hypothetical protein